MPGLAALAAGAALVGCLGTEPDGEAGIYRVRADGSGLERIAVAEARPAWSPDGERIAWTAEDGLWAAAADGSDARRLAAVRRGAPPAWSPDGEEIAVVDLGRQLLAVVPADGAPAQETSLAVAPAATPAPIPMRNVPSWSPDGRSLAVVAWDGSGDELFRVDVSEALSAPARMTSTRPSNEPMAAERTGSARRAVGNVISPAWSPDGTAIAFALVAQASNGPSGIYVLDPASGAARRVAEGMPVWGPLWSPDGDRLLAIIRGDDAAPLLLIDPETSAMDPVAIGDGLVPRDGAWSPDGTRIAFSSPSGIHLVDLASGSVSLVADTPLDDLSPTWSPDGAWIAFRAEPDRFAQPSLPPVP